MAGVTATALIPPLAHDSCESDAQCLNGGRCHLYKPGQIRSGADNEYNYCACHEGFGGLRCEAYCPLQCLNGGLCHAQQPPGGANPALHSYSKSYSCKCLGHWTGAVCDMPYENCVDGSQCYNGGKCSQRNVTITVSFCECPAGLGGVACQDEVAVQEPEEGVFTKPQATSLSLGIVLAVTGTVGLAFIFVRRRMRRRRLGMTYATVQPAEDCPNEVEAPNPGLQQNEKWRNVV